MTITQLSTFLIISEMKSFSAAASSLGYAQSTVTTQIKQLEDELGCVLFERLGKTISITSSGERLIAYAEKMLQLEREIRLDVTDEENPAGVLKLGVSESLCVSRFPRILMEYTKNNPRTEIRIQFVTHDDIPELLQKGELDMVYTLNPLIEDERVKILHKKRESLGFYASPTNPVVDKTIREKDLKNVPLLLTGHNCNFRHMLISDLDRHEISPNIVLETSSKEILKQFAINGLGVAFIPDITSENEIKTGKLKRLTWKGEDFPIYSQVLIHKDKKQNKAIKALAEIIMRDKENYGEK
ncbi:LysR family transcriptional regulator [Butyrivibrio sp. AE3003]|uniref:LysR family transcriptional regulator n=1 Tax=Butyrivibrio sp. AE3003 TaxID=1496721 RepID=UPI00047B7588|nr:LysR family transcriptional regulator [Butyrivibrio sp. AE3003]